MRYHVEAVGTYGYLLPGERCGEGCARAQAQRWFRIPFILFYDRTTQITHTLHHHHTTLGHSFSFPCYRLRFFIVFSFSLLFLDNRWPLAATPTYVPVTDSFASYSTRVQYATCASIRTYTITPSPPFPYRTYTHIIDAHYIHQLFLSRYNVANPSPKSDGCNEFFS